MYALETTGVREGVFKVNRRIWTPIVVTPRDEVGAAVRAGMSAGWKNTWAEEKMRKGIWGDYATARVVVSLSPPSRILDLQAWGVLANLVREGG